MRKDLTIVILSYNQREDILRCLDSLRGIDARIIVVDNNSTDGTRHVVLEGYPGVRVIKHNKNIGITRARNAGVRAVRTPYVLVLDADTEISPDTVAQLLEHLKIHRGAGVVAPALVDGDGRPLSTHLPYPGLWYLLRRLLGYRFRNDSRRAKWVSGAVMMFSRRTYSRVGPFDEKIFYGPDDADFCLRVLKTGKRIDYLPGLTAMHRQGHRHSGLFSRLGRKNIAATRYFWRKHGRWI